MTGQPSNCYIQAIEPSQLLLLTEKNRTLLIEQIPHLETYFLAMMQKGICGSPTPYRFYL